MARQNRRSLPVSSQPIVAQTEGEVQFLAQALDYYRAVQRAGKEAPFGQFLNAADNAVTEKGQELLRQSLENIVQTEIDEIEKKTSRDSVRIARRNEDTSATAVKPSEPPTDSSRRNWDKRNRRMLPDVHACVAFASIEAKALFQQRVNTFRSLLRVGSTGDISALGDGAECPSC